MSKIPYRKINFPKINWAEEGSLELTPELSPEIYNSLKEVLDTISFNDYIKEAQNENNRPVLLTIQNAEAEHFVAVKLR